MMFHDLLLERTATHGERPALWRNDDCLTYVEFEQLARNVADNFRALSVNNGDRIAVYLDKRIEGIIAFFAASLSGAVFVPVNPVLKPAQVAHILNDCDVSVLVTSNSRLNALDSELANCERLDHVIVTDQVEDDRGNADLVNVHAWSDFSTAAETPTMPTRRIDNDVASIFYTSGSTGKPKGVVLSHRNMTMGAVSVASYLENTSDDVILAALPLSFDAGFSQLTTAFSVGATAVLLDYLLPRDIPKVAAKFRVTGLTGVPPLWNQLAGLHWPDEAITSMRYIANTGGAMPTATLEKLRAQLPSTKVFLMYGLTESFRSTYLPPEELDSRPTSIGKAIPNAEVLVVRPDGTPCEPGEPGELIHRGALVSLGYWNDAERTAERFRPVPNQATELPMKEMAVWSGDTVVKDEQGFIYFVGRKDDMIKSSGYRISPTELEEVIYASGLIDECAALGIPHPDIGQAVVIAALTQNPSDETATSLVNACRKALPNFMVPAKIIWRDELPRNPNGKIDRKKLATDLQDLFQADK